jgi:hypothetical protein
MVIAIFELSKQATYGICKCSCSVSEQLIPQFAEKIFTYLICRDY